MVRIKPRFSTPGISKYVIKDSKTGEICYRVPSDCVGWPQPFRLRIVRDCIDGKDLSPSVAESYVRYMTMTPFIVQRIGVQFIIRVTPVNKSLSTVNTFLLADGRDVGIRLAHSNAAVRSLMAYSYITGAHIGGMPKLQFTHDLR